MAQPQHESAAQQSNRRVAMSDPKVGATTIGPGPIRSRVGRLARLTSGTSRVWALTALLTAAAALLAGMELGDGRPADPPLEIPLWLLAALFYVTEARVVHLHIGRSAHSFSMSEIPVVYGIFFFQPGEFILARLIGAGLALVISRRQRSVKLAFNVAQFFLCSVVTLGIVHVLDFAGPAFGPRDWITAFLATAAENVVGVFAVTAAISLAEGALQLDRIPRMLGMGAVVSLTNTSLALLMITILLVEPTAALLFAVPIVAVFVAYRAYLAEREQHEGVEMLYESTRILQRSPQLDRALAALLDHARRMFRAEVAELSLLSIEEGGEILRICAGDGEVEGIMKPIGIVLDDPGLLRCLAERRAFRVAQAEPSAGDPETPRFRNAIYAPLAGESRLVGTMVVANRLSDISAFDDDDVRLFEMLASHTAVALENSQLEQSLSSLSRLKEELHHKAYHDSLTGLANRAFFSQSVALRLESADASGLVPVVLFIDIDDFKIVNDTLGHAAGDSLLASVAERIQAVLRAGDLAARIGGDEFAVLLWDTPEMPLARRIADRLIGAFGTVSVADGAPNPHVSIGVAGGHPGSGSANELLRNADVAMYSAKARGKNRVVFFEPEMATAVEERHSLTESLQRAVAADEFVLHYQPIVDVASGRMTGLESLVRWVHPKRGMNWPGEFIGVAEGSDLILDIGRWVLERSCRQAAAWHERWPGARLLEVSINVAARQLEQADFVDQVGAILRSSGVDPSTVVLEVTETTLLQNVDDAIAKLSALRQLGIGLAIDDFGTGYSSLSYLQRFPATSIKIARDFVAVDERDVDSWELVSAIVSMGRALRLTVVAEGVEEPFQLERLRRLQCNRAQGYYLARPRAPEDLEPLFQHANRSLIPTGEHGSRLALSLQESPPAA
jgi:diguanylate cyclase (GGDEF)-like protein